MKWILKAQILFLKTYEIRVFWYRFEAVEVFGHVFVGREDRSMRNPYSIWPADTKYIVHFKDKIHGI